ncbi:MAG: hypothetical protein CL565_06605 [Alphaproteobacteria bacterium]|nr:hypothetical protein [Alphaproteobacteria bacterium]
MLDKLKKRFGFTRPDRKEEKKMASDGSLPERMKLAKSKKTSPDILYYLAEHDKDASIRQAVAKNTATPLQASKVLSKDTDIDVRLALAERLIYLLPQLSEDKQGQIYTFAVNALGALALDEVLKIRVALSSALKDHVHAPPKIVLQLAKDIEREVSEPVLRYCILLPDEDLMEILKGHPASWAISAIASREKISEALSTAVYETEDEPGTLALIGNTGAEIAVQTLTSIVQKAKDLPDWHKPLASNPHLPPELAKEMAFYADQSVRDILLARTDFDNREIEDISKAFKRRLAFLEEEDSGKTALQRVQEAYAKGELDDEFVMDAIGVRDTEFVEYALAAKTSIPVEAVRKVMKLHAPKPTIALVWKAGLSMRTALAIQREIAKVPSAEIMNPRGGTDYPLTKEELEWQLDFLGLS